MPLHISRILHAGYVFDCKGTRIAFDTIFENPFSRNCHAFPPVRFDHDKIRLLRFDAVFISHFHDDHCSLESLDLLDRATPLHIYCQFDALFAMVRALGFLNVYALALDMPVEVGPFAVTPRIAMDADVDALFQIDADGLKVLNVVDSWIDPDTLPALAAHGPWDMVLWPFQTMRELEVLSPSRAAPAPAAVPAEWIAELRALDPRFVVPGSCQFLQEPWSWYNRAFFPVSYRQFQAQVEAALPDARVVRMDPAASMRLDHAGLTPAGALDWVVPAGDRDADYDYDYDPHAAPPATGEIARRFPALSAEQAGCVDAYCRTGLLERYRAMELPEDSFFARPRIWRLSVFDHAGTETRHHYRVEKDGIDPVAPDAAPLAWTTEIPAAKLYAALANGESLTSMYMRINDMRFDAATETDLETAELVDDPLIRCLFNDAFGAYQAAQLRRLKETP
ncbi:MBL fold metallo-hydrolase [Massilia jejuensis]|uniref:MBL fold metallo-hydrolase n=1 Tax=Massilia jejuensis TaxID=648894 RepID=A0ABW0PNJ6_9BURK